MTCFPYPSILSTLTKNRLKIGVVFTVFLTKLCSQPCGLLKGQTRMQFEQLPLFLSQNREQFSAFIGHLSTLILLETPRAWSVLSPDIIALLGQASAQRRHLSQKACTPISIGESTCKGSSVKTLQILTLGPNCSVIRSPFLPNSPRPASMARGIISANPQLQGIA